jgi:predicted enzyme related to lactoylglutathione lyase
MSKGKITGIGGIFFKCNDPNKTKDWYKNSFGLKTNQWGAPFEFKLANPPNARANTQWSTFPSDTKYFDPSENELMINYRVGNLKKKGVVICDEIKSYDYSKFVHILDVDGRKIELWEPVDRAFDSMYPEGSTNK